MSKYFLKNGTLHTYPRAKNCNVKYDGEELLDNPPAGGSNAACGKCFTFPPPLGKNRKSGSC